MDKIKVKRITIEWTEASHIVKDNTTVKTFKEASELISKIAAHSHNEGYTKTAFVIEWEDGRTHRGRIDVQHKHIMQINPIGDHVKFFYENLAGIRKPHGLTDEEHKAHLKAIYNIDEKGMEEMKQILDTYLLEDVSEESQVDEQSQQQETINNSGITITLNSEFNGIEIRFPEKPSQDIIEQLKENGFRWSKRGFWYAKQSPERLKFAESLGIITDQIGTNKDPVVYPEINIDDLDKYTVSDELQRRVHHSSLFEVDYKKDCATTFKNIQNKALEVLSMTDDPYMIYKIKKYLQSYKKRYYEQYIKILNHKANNPSWMVTGRGGLNVRRYNKMQDRYDNLIGQQVQMMKEFEKKIRDFKWEILDIKDRQWREQINNSLDKTELQDVFTVVTKEASEHKIQGYNKKLRFYKYKDYAIVKAWGMYRIFKNGKEIKTTLKTTDTLETAKRYVLMLDKQEHNELITV